MPVSGKPMILCEQDDLFWCKMDSCKALHQAFNAEMVIETKMSHSLALEINESCCAPLIPCALICRRIKLVHAL